MAKFKFRLQSVLDYREEVEKGKRQLLSVEEEKLKVLNDKFIQVECELEENRQLLDTQRFTLFEYQQLIHYKDLLILKKDELSKKIYQQEKVVSQFELDWQEAKKEVCVLEKLKEKKELLFKEELDKKEAQELDEMATMRF